MSYDDLEKRVEKLETAVIFGKIILGIVAGVIIIRLIGLD